MPEEKKWKIWYRQYDENGNQISSGVYCRDYVNYGSAIRAARKAYGDRQDIEYTIAIRYPWKEYTCDAVCEICGSGYSMLETNEGYPVYERINICGLYETVPVTPVGVLYPKPNLTKGYMACPECITRVYNFIESLKASES